ncbi:hypothetical protein SAMN04487996_104317 [Dyadobacter soli]|uniref:Outer membrane protein beta-barrel domain-containing protein n=1 Tax=Dyadobacter soli TaxID=659014 RepID=A0A1G7BUP8_9BACT|nr:hypothetical protein [Dyadobacter soli]SDE30864.1 hypothetical protein SAMN04487996_104317 [Dyadobacter soli]
MKTLLTIIMTIYISCLTPELAAQNTSKWEFGVAAGLGRTYYDRNYYEDSRKFKDDGGGYISHFKSNYVWGTGLWVERHINARFSGLLQFAYHQTDILPDVFSQWYDSGFWYARETHHHARAESGIRWYINPRSKFKLFIEAKAGIEKFLTVTEHPFYEEKLIIRDAFGYDLVLPVASATAGIKWRRFALAADYGQDILGARRDDPEKFGPLPEKAEIKTKRITVKATFTIFK